MSTASFYALANARLTSLATRDTDDERAREHMDDFIRTRITPGADPRAEWANNDSPRDSGLFTGPDDSGYSEILRARTREFGRSARRWVSHRGARRSVFEIASDNGGVTWCVEPYNSRAVGNYVPRDVFRWRDPEHRAALTARARAWAAIVPGRPTNSTPVAGQQVNAQSTSELEREG